MAHSPDVPLAGLLNDGLDLDDALPGEPFHEVSQLLGPLQGGGEAEGEEEEEREGQEKGEIPPQGGQEEENP